MGAEIVIAIHQHLQQGCEHGRTGGLSRKVKVWARMIVEPAVMNVGAFAEPMVRDPVCGLLPLSPSPDTAIVTGFALLGQAGGEHQARTLTSASFDNRMSLFGA